MDLVLHLVLVLVLSPHAAPPELPHPPSHPPGSPQPIHSSHSLCCSSQLPSSSSELLKLPIMARRCTALS